MSVRLLGIEIGAIAAGHCSAAQSSQESTNESFAEAKDEEHVRCTRSTLFGNHRLGQNLVDIALINPDGDGSHRQIHEERTHDHEEVCPEASRKHAWKPPDDCHSSINEPPDKKAPVPKRRADVWKEGQTSGNDIWPVSRATGTPRGYKTYAW